MIRLLYISQAKGPINEDEINKILKSSKKNNPAFDLTGVLIYGGKMFMQVLEGPEHSVLRQYVKILDDPRHDDASIIYLSPCNERMFENWAMGVIRNSTIDFQYITQLKSNRLESIHAVFFRNTMKEFLNALKLEPQ
ncbi:MAG: BLUF domain-containing protein [Pseudomonadota bacterium]